MRNQHFSKAFVAALVFAFAFGAFVTNQKVLAQTAQTASSAPAADPNLWLEDIDGQRAKRPVKCEKLKWSMRKMRLPCALSSVYAPAGRPSTDGAF